MSTYRKEWCRGFQFIWQLFVLTIILSLVTLPLSLVHAAIAGGGAGKTEHADLICAIAWIIFAGAVLPYLVAKFGRTVGLIPEENCGPNQRLQGTPESAPPSSTEPEARRP